MSGRWVYVNECANCNQLAHMVYREDVKSYIWLNYCPACIDNSQAAAHWEAR